VASLSQGRTAAAQCGLFTHKSVPVIFEPPCTIQNRARQPFFWCGTSLKITDWIMLHCGWYTISGMYILTTTAAKWHYK